MTAKTTTDTTTTVGEPSRTSMDNHTLLIQLTDSVSSMGKQFTTHIAEQQVENDKLYRRIDLVQDETRKGVDEIKVSLSSRGKISSTQVFSLVAVLVSLLTLFGGIAQAYISVRLDAIMPVIESNTAMIVVANTERAALRTNFSALQVDVARTDATSQEALRWIERELGLVKQPTKP